MSRYGHMTALARLLPTPSDDVLVDGHGRFLRSLRIGLDEASKETVDNN